MILFTKGGGAWLERMAATGADALGVDWTTELSAARAATSDRVALQGNLDPKLLLFAARRDPRGASRACSRATAAGTGTSSTSATASQPDVDPSTSPR